MGKHCEKWASGIYISSILKVLQCWLKIVALPDSSCSMWIQSSPSIHPSSHVVVTSTASGDYPSLEWIDSPESFSFRCWFLWIFLSQNRMVIHIVRPVLWVIDKDQPNRTSDTRLFSSCMATSIEEWSWDPRGDEANILSKRRGYLRGSEEYYTIYSAGKLDRARPMWVSLHDETNANLRSDPIHFRPFFERTWSVDVWLFMTVSYPPGNSSQWQE